MIPLSFSKTRGVSHPAAANGRGRMRRRCPWHVQYLFAIVPWPYPSKCAKRFFVMSSFRLIAGMTTSRKNVSAPFEG